MAVSFCAASTLKIFMPDCLDVNNDEQSFSDQAANRCPFRARCVYRCRCKTGTTDQNLPPVSGFLPEKTYCSSIVPQPALNSADKAAK
jgi:hypothetical protein